MCILVLRHPHRDRTHSRLEGTQRATWRFAMPLSLHWILSRSLSAGVSPRRTPVVLVGQLRIRSRATDWPLFCWPASPSMVFPSVYSSCDRQCAVRSAHDVIEPCEPEPSVRSQSDSTPAAPSSLQRADVSPRWASAWDPRVSDRFGVRPESPGWGWSEQSTPLRRAIVLWDHRSRPDTWWSTDHSLGTRQ